MSTQLLFTNASLQAADSLHSNVLHSTLPCHSSAPAGSGGGRGGGGGSPAGSGGCLGTGSSRLLLEGPAVSAVVLYLKKERGVQAG